MQNKNTLIALTGLVALASLSGAANAAVTPAYSTTFNSPTYSDGPLIGQDGWVITGTTTTTPLTVANTATNGNVTIGTGGQDANRPFGLANNFSLTNAASSTAYLSATISVASSNTAGDYFLHLSDGGTSAFNGRIYAKADSTTTPTGFFLGVASSNANITYGTTLLSFGQSYNILETLESVAGGGVGTGNDIATLYVNPVSPDGVGSTAYVSSTGGGTDAGTIAAVNIRQGSGGPLVTLDNIAVGYAPEPATLAALAGFGIMGLRRRK